MCDYRKEKKTPKSKYFTTGLLKMIAVSLNERRNIVPVPGCDFAGDAHTPIIRIKSAPASVGEERERKKRSFIRGE